jgi:hypothetical protein
VYVTYFYSVKDSDGSFYHMFSPTPSITSFEAAKITQTTCKVDLLHLYSATQELLRQVNAIVTTMISARFRHEWDLPEDTMRSHKSGVTACSHLR